jgi:hypothetical protein
VSFIVNRMHFLRACFLVSLLSFIAPSVRAQNGLFGLTLGMSRQQALRVLGKPLNSLDDAPYRGGQQMLTDTVPFSFCKLLMRRSVGFDSTYGLKAIGLSYKTIADNVQQSRDCAFQWLTNEFGHASQEYQEDGVTHDVWLLGPAKLTLEAKNYNPHDYFVLIYYYSSKD